MFKTKQIGLSIGSKEIQVEIIANIDELLEAVVEEDDIPFWAELWPAALGLADHLATRDLANLQVLELGAGLGIPGIIAALQGGRVTQTDYVPAALELAERNNFLNGLTDGEYHILDWRKPKNLGKYQLIIGSDILYEPKLYKDLMAVVDQHLSPGGEMIISDPGRGGVCEFLGILEAKAWTYEQTSCQVDYQEMLKRIDIYSIKKP